MKRCNVKIDKKIPYNLKRSHLRNKFDRAIENYSKDFEFIQKQINNQKTEQNRDENSQFENNTDYETTSIENTIKEFRHRIQSTSLDPNLILDQTAEPRTPWYEIMFDTIKSNFNIRCEKTKVDQSDQIKFKIFNRVSRIDRVARVFYPVSFAIFNLIYWKYYLAQRDIHQDDIIKLA